MTHIVLRGMSSKKYTRYVFEMQCTSTCTIYNYMYRKESKVYLLMSGIFFSRARRKLQEVFSQDDGLNIGMLCYIFNLCTNNLDIIKTASVFFAPSKTSCLQEKAKKGQNCPKVSGKFGLSLKPFW